MFEEIISQNEMSRLRVVLIGECVKIFALVTEEVLKKPGSTPYTVCTLGTLCRVK